MPENKTAEAVTKNFVTETVKQTILHYCRHSIALSKTVSIVYMFDQSALAKTYHLRIKLKRETLISESIEGVETCIADNNTI